VPGLLEYITEVDSEASDVESPHFEGVTGIEILWESPGVVGTAPMEEVGAEEEEENSHVYFKQKRKGKPCKKKVMKKPRRQTLVIMESESVGIVPPPASLVIKLSAQKKIPEKAAPALGKISSCL